MIGSDPAEVPREPSSPNLSIACEPRGEQGARRSPADVFRAAYVRTGLQAASLDSNIDKLMYENSELIFMNSMDAAISLLDPVDDTHVEESSRRRI